MNAPTGLALYQAAAMRASQPVIRLYSNSFRLATSLFPRRARTSIAAIYALVRIADEIVDGTAAAAGLDTVQQRTVLDELEREVEQALERGFSANLVVQSFADVARRSGIDTTLTRPFFASMRRDLEPVDFGRDEYLTYVHGSAEVVGLMCLRVFLVGKPTTGPHRERLESAAKALGSAFQKVNFLRDLSVDRSALGRSYLPEVRGDFDATAKRAVIADIRADLACARAGVPLLPKDCRLAVAAASAIFTELLHRIERTPVDRLARERVSVPPMVKLRLVASERLRLLRRPA